MNAIKLGVISCLIMLGACTGFITGGEPQTLISEDGKVSLTVSGDWKTTEELNESAVIQAMNGSHEKYAIVLEYTKEDFSYNTLADFNTYTVNSMFEVLKGAFMTQEPEAVDVNGLQGVISEFRGDMNGINICYILLTAEYTSHYFQVLAWTIPSKYKDNHDELIHTVLSFNVFTEKFKDSDHSGSEIKSSDGLDLMTVYDSEKRISLTVPSDWTLTDELNEDADIQVFNGGIEGYVIVLSEYKMDFKDMDYMKHSKMTRNALMESIAHPDSDNSSKVVDINGKRSVWFTIRGSVSNINVRYTHVTVDGTDMFHQILGWTIPSKEMDTQPVIEQIIKSFTEVSR